MEGPGRGTPHPYERLERLGKGSWWALGMALLAILGFVLLARFGTFIIPSLMGIVLATTLSPIVGWLARWHVPRLAGAALLTLFVIVGLVVLTWGIVTIMVNQGPQIWSTLTSGVARIDGWLGRAGAARGTIARLHALSTSLQRGAVSGALPLALRGVREIYAVVVAVFLAASFSFFFLWEGPEVRRWASRHLGQPEDVGLKITASLVRTTRRYVAGLSCIGASQAVVVGATAAIAGVGAWPVIAFVIFLGNYIPYIGGLIAGAFAVLLALGSQGPGAALAVLIAIAIAYFAGSHLGVFFIGEAIRLPVTAVFVLTMTGAAVAGIFGAAAAAPLARLAIDARDIIAAHREPGGGSAAAGESPVDGNSQPPVAEGP
ncbi:MAG TPA: AI-2E family transporter [Thermoleophilia bacterium]